MKNIVQEFIETTPHWADQIMADKDKPCMVCGIIPQNMLELAEAVKVLAEKAWKYDELNH